MVDEAGGLQLPGGIIYLRRLHVLYPGRDPRNRTHPFDYFLLQIMTHPPRYREAKDEYLGAVRVVFILFSHYQLVFDQALYPGELVPDYIRINRFAAYAYLAVSFYCSFPPSITAQSSPYFPLIIKPETIYKRKDNVLHASLRPFNTRGGTMGIGLSNTEE